MEDRILENELNIDSPVENTDHLINENRNRILDGLERQRQNALDQASSIYVSGLATRSVVEVGSGFGAMLKIFQDYEEAKDVLSGTVEIGKAGYDEVKDRLKSQRRKLGGSRELLPRPEY